MLSPPQRLNYVVAEGTYSGHLQGITTNGLDAIYWSFTTKVVKTDTAGNLLSTTPNVIDHHGDLTYANGKVYVAVNDRVSNNPGQFNYPNPNNPPRQWIYEYDSDLNYIKRHAVPQVIYGAGGVAYHDDHFWVVGGLPGPWLGGFDPATYNKNYVYEYDASFNYVQTHDLPTGNTDRGIQTAEFGGGKWWFGTYETDPRRPVGGSSPAWRRQIYVFDEELSDDYTRFGLHASQPTGTYPDGSVGIAALPNGLFLVGGDGGSGSNRLGYVWMAEVNEAGKFSILSTIPENVVGDHNGDGMVNAADYAVWRDAMGDSPRYDEWKANFGSGVGLGAVAGLVLVPEPGTWKLLASAFVAIILHRHRSTGIGH